MAAFLWHISLCILSIRTLVTGKLVTSCHEISMECDQRSHQIVIRKANTTSDQLLKSLFRCNGHNKCLTPNINNECVKVSYWCRMDFPILHNKRSSDVEITENVTLVGLMSEDYLWGEYQNAEDVHCNVSFSNEETKEISFLIHELTSLMDSSGMCLILHGSDLSQQLCSDSKIYDKRYGPYSMKQGLQFSIRQVDHANTDKKFRFWIDIKDYEDEVVEFNLKCHSKAASSRSLKPVNAIGMAVMGTILLPTILTVIIVTVLVFRQKKGRSRDAVDYTYIEVNHTNASRETARERPNLPAPRVQDITVSQSTDAIARLNNGEESSVSSGTGSKCSVHGLDRDDVAQNNILKKEMAMVGPAQRASEKVSQEILEMASLEQDVDVPPQIVTPESDENGEESVAENEYEPLSSEQTAHTDDKSNGEAEKVYMPLDNKEWHESMDETSADGLPDQINGFTDEHNELESIEVGGERTEMNSTR